MLPGQPGDGKEKQGQAFGQGRAFFPFPDDASSPTVDGEDGSHLEGIEKDGGNGAGGRHEPDPEGGGYIEAQECDVIVPEGVANLDFAELSVELEKRDEGDQGQESETRDEVGEARQQDETGHQQPQVSFRVGRRSFVHFRACLKHSVTKIGFLRECS